jgi:drug/metabolite transporter (DMT)-like permease
MAAYLGELAALATSVMWSGTATFFTFGARQVGSVVINRMRLLVALILLGVTHWVLLGQPLPLQAEPDRWIWLGLSGVIGLVLGDAFLFQSYLWIGPRLGMLMMSVAPVIAALLAWLFLGESLTALQWAGVMVTVGGVALVVLDRSQPRRQADAQRNYRLGILFGIGAAAGQAIGLILAKKGLMGDFPALSGNVIRMTAAASTMWLATLLARQAAPTWRRIWESPKVITPLLAGSITGPFLGVWLSLIAVQRTQIGVASTLMALPPVFLLPIGHFVFKERIGLEAIAGTLVAIGGVALLFLT